MSSKRTEYLVDVPRTVVQSLVKSYPNARRKSSFIGALYPVNFREDEQGQIRGLSCFRLAKYTQRVSGGLASDGRRRRGRRSSLISVSINMPALQWVLET
jgi:hypothetical protein